MILYSELFDELEKELGLSKREIKDIVKTEFKALQVNIRSRTLKSVNMIYLGKFRPTKWFLNNQDKFTKTKEEYEIIKQARRNKKGLV
jgi:nucleoid DNA-binding protein